MASRRQRAGQRPVRWLSIETTARRPEVDRPEHLATWVAKGLNPVSDETHAEVLALVDDLAAVGASGETPLAVNHLGEPRHMPSH